MNMSKRKMDNASDPNLNQKIPNISTSPATHHVGMQMSQNQVRNVQITIEELEDIKIQILGILHDVASSDSVSGLDVLLQYLHRMSYDLNYTYQPYGRDYIVAISYPWQPRYIRQLQDQQKYGGYLSDDDDIYTSINAPINDSMNESNKPNDPQTDAISISTNAKSVEMLLNDDITSRFAGNSYTKNVRLVCILPFTPLQYAAYLGADKLILPLLRAGSNKSLKALNYTTYEFASKTAAEIALQRGYHRVFHMIEEYNEDAVMNVTIPQQIYDLNIQHLSNPDPSSSMNDSLSNTSSPIKALAKTSLNRVSSNEVFLDNIIDSTATDYGVNYDSMTNEPTKSVGIDLLQFITDEPMKSPLSNESKVIVEDTEEVITIPIDPQDVSVQGLETSLQNNVSNVIGDADLTPPRQFPLPCGAGSHAGYKTPTEDRIVITEICTGVTLYIVLDGHGGSHYADDVSKQLPSRIQARILALKELKAQDIEAILIEEIIELDKELVRLGDDVFLYTKGGTTCVAAVITTTDIIVANVGDSPAIVFSSNGLLLRQTEDHNPENKSEYARIKELGANIVLSNEFGDLRVQSGRGQLTVTRALGQYEFKKGGGGDIRPVNEQIVTSMPQTYIWSFDSIIGQKPSPSNGMSSNQESGRCFLALYSDSFTEALRDHRSGRIVAGTGRPEQVIGNFLTNVETLEFILYELKRFQLDVHSAAQDIAEKQVHKFHFYKSFFGDNTSIILVDLCLITYLTQDDAIASTATSSALSSSMSKIPLPFDDQAKVPNDFEGIVSQGIPGKELDRKDSVDIDIHDMNTAIDPDLLF